MNIDRLRETLKRDEGFELKRHEVQGIDHIGYGINLEQELPDELLGYLGVEAEDAIEEITQEHADYLLDYYVEVAEGDCKTIYGDIWQHLSPLRQEVLINLAFNLGLPRLKAFRKMNAAIRAEDWAAAAAQMLDSKAARQTGKRYHRLARTFGMNDESYLKLDKIYDEPTVRQDLSVIPTGEELAGVEDQVLIAELARRLGLNEKARRPENEQILLSRSPVFPFSFLFQKEKTNEKGVCCIVRCVVKCFDCSRLLWRYCHGS